MVIVLSPKERLLSPHVFVAHDHVVFTEDLEALLLAIPSSVLLGDEMTGGDGRHRSERGIWAVGSLWDTGLGMDSQDAFPLLQEGRLGGWGALHGVGVELTEW